MFDPTLLNQLSEGVIVADRDGKLMFVNQAAERLHGVKALEVAPDAYSETYHLFTEDGDPYPFDQLPLARAVLHGETIDDARWRIRRPDGSEILAIGSARPLFNDDERIGAILTLRDDTARHSAEAALRMSEQRLRLVQTAGGIGSFDYDLQTDEAVCSPEYYAMFGLTEEHRLNRAAWEHILHPDDRDATIEALNRSIAERQTLDFEYRIVRADNGEVRWLTGRASIMFDDADEPWRFVGASIDITDRRAAEDAQRASEEQMRLVLDTAPGAFYSVDREGNTTLVSRGFLEMMGFATESDAVGEKLHTLIHHSHPDGSPYPVEQCPIYRCASAGISAHVPDELFFRIDGSPVPVEYWVSPIMSDDVHVGATCTILDLTDRKAAELALKRLNETLEERVEQEVARRTEAEDALRQSQKMETIGQLTGGIAHDFNNLLQIISGNLDILRRLIADDSPRLRRSVENAARGADRAAILTQRLLAFSRRQPLSPKVIDPNKLVSGMSEMLHRTIGETIQVETILESGLWAVEVDPNQLESALLNLAVNSRDAMPNGGKLTVETTNAHLDRDYAMRNTGVSAGQYVLISISDSGTGMDSSTAERAFDPFFTTKDVGKGTGLGLSMVYGFVKQSGGHLKIYSELGEGTTIKVYLPRHHGPLDESDDRSADQRAPEGVDGETILVCEDDEDVRAFSAQALRDLGYRVIEAADGAAALRLIEADDGQIDLLFTDVVLPGGLDGRAVAERARQLRPDLKVLFTTGYARNAIVHQGRLDPGVELLSKPFAYADLAARVRDLLDAG